MGAVDGHQTLPRGLVHAGPLLAHLRGAGEHPHPAAGHEVLAARLENLQPSMLVAVALVVEAPAGGIRSLRPHLIHQPLRGSLRLQLPDRQWVLCRCVNGLTIKHQRVARVLTVVRNDQSVAHERVLLSPFLSRDHAAWVNPAMVLVSLAADQLSAPTSAGSAISPEPSDPGLKQVPRPSNSVHPSQTVNDGIKDGTDGGTHRPKPSHSSRSGPLHTDTLSVGDQS